MEVETGYVRLGGEQIAYQVVGEGPPDLVLSAGTFGSIDRDWEDPMVARMYRSLGAFCRLIRFDRRGSGASDPVPRLALPPWERAAATVERIEQTWGTEEQARIQVPSRAIDPHFRRWFAKYTAASRPRAR